MRKLRFIDQNRQNEDSNSHTFNSKDRADHSGLDIHQCPTISMKRSVNFHMFGAYVATSHPFDLSQSELWACPIAKSRCLHSVPGGTQQISGNGGMNESANPVFTSQVHMRSLTSKKTGPGSFCRCFFSEIPSAPSLWILTRVSSQKSSIIFQVFLLQISDSMNT